ncbi:post-GPI attachment to proteins factor 2-like [Penaeus monodon]|uniref:post-GPI attachment to proteins factor 2-like n=1 Tax=Penaeus monodon TaxID=6687 RepID=UPI0018A727EF|nr:post-GPI attachment to proteins factor 2-like [Penaeus monodon]
MMDSDSVVRIPLRRLAVVTVSLPFGAFFLCIYLSLRHNFDLSTATHCGVPNYLPSISSAIGEFVPQRYIWRAAIAVHSAPRFLIAAMYNSFMSRILPNIKFYRVSTCVCVLECAHILYRLYKETGDIFEVPGTEHYPPPPPPQTKGL